ATRFLPATCPADYQVRFSVRSFSMSYEPLCEIASSFSWLFVSASALFCAIYVGRAFGGE
ncbi:virulence factor TspB C-terminal domain-related protein, partial [Stutzerimonas frequens]